MESHTEKQGKPRYTSESASPFEISKQRVNIKDVVVACVFMATVGIVWGSHSSQAADQKEKLSSLFARVEKNEAVTNQLILEVEKVRRDTEWIRAYLTRKDPSKNQP